MRRVFVRTAAVVVATALVGTLAGTAGAELLSSENWDSYALGRASPNLDGWEYVTDVASPTWNTLDNLNSVSIVNARAGDPTYPAGYSGEQFVDMNASYLWQNTGQSFTEGVTYTLSLKATAATPGERIYMYLADSNPVEGPELGTSLAVGYYDVPDTDFSWNEYALSYTAGAADAGKDLVFALYGRGATYIDDISVVSNAPEPSSLALGIIGLTGLALAGRWRKRAKVSS